MQHMAPIIDADGVSVPKQVCISLVVLQVYIINMPDK